MKIQLLITIIFSTHFFMPINSQSWWDMTYQEVRKGINERIMNIETREYPVYAIENHVINKNGRETPLRLYFPNQKTDLPVILMIHGGAWVAGNLDTHDNLARYLCSQVEAIVVAVGYTNAPEGKFPLQLEQCYDSLKWIVEYGLSMKIVVVGDSSGANMAAALCLMARDRQGPKIGLQVLINPGTDLTCKGLLEQQNDYLDLLRWQVNQYLSNLEDVQHPYVSPMNAKDLTLLPSALILVAEMDEARSDGEQYAQRLIESGVPTQLYCQKRIGHLAGHGARASSQAKESLDVAVIAIKNHFYE